MLLHSGEKDHAHSNEGKHYHEKYDKKSIGDGYVTMCGGTHFCSSILMRYPCVNRWD